MNIFTGIYLNPEINAYNPILQNLIFTYLIVLITWKIYYEIKQHQSSKNLQYIQTMELSRSYKLTSKQQRLIEIIDKEESIDEIMAEINDINWVIIDDNIYDVTNFNHPGGNYLIQLSKGKEISRYFYGAYGFTPKDKGHKHSVSANNLLQSMYIGKLPSIFQLIKSKHTKEIEDLDYSPTSYLINIRESNKEIKSSIKTPNENLNDNTEDINGNFKK